MHAEDILRAFFTERDKRSETFSPAGERLSLRSHSSRQWNHTGQR